MVGSPREFARLLPHAAHMILTPEQRPRMDVRSRIALVASGATLESPLADWPGDV